jgi:hypothetical protein
MVLVEFFNSYRSIYKLVADFGLVTIGSVIGYMLFMLLSLLAFMVSVNVEISLQ